MLHKCFRDSGINFKNSHVKMHYKNEKLVIKFLYNIIMLNISRLTSEKFNEKNTNTIVTYFKVNKTLVHDIDLPQGTL